MKQLPDDLYQKIETLNKSVKEKLKIKGIIVPIQNNDGSIRIGRYSIKKYNTGFYSVLDYRGEAIVDRINLPHTAALIANKLALGKWMDYTLVNIDRQYGHAEFDEMLHTHLADKNIKRKDYDRAEVMLAKSSVAKYRKDQYKKTITNDFDKLLNFR